MLIKFPHPEKNILFPLVKPLRSKLSKHCSANSILMLEIAYIVHGVIGLAFYGKHLKERLMGKKLDIFTAQLKQETARLKVMSAVQFTQQ